MWRRLPAYAAASATRDNYAMAATWAAGGRFCCLGGGIRTSEANVPSRPRLLHRRDDARLLSPLGAAAPAGEDERGARGQRRPRFLCLHGFRTSGEIMSSRCFSYIEELMIRKGPFDGLLGFSQGAGVSAVLAGLQEQGLALTGVAKVRCVIVIAGAKVRSPPAATRAFAGKIKCPSLHFIGINYNHFSASLVRELSL
ncbi:hypothetical protein PR202_ga20151 [Eleusine coracana subsp. coracana]|uniref:Serine hydrolase domain-containing protein n=1 Tax=Eleusine coracana subsp. coracana TaxID=191504 RepID=A0AAV5CY04_ELECO|nr:hypothetical protein PR202_ga20151 [Eleusine coracana subsp. coracana]